MDAGFDVSEGVARRDSAEGAGGEVEEAQSDRQLGDEHLPLRCYISMRSLPSIQQVCSSSFRDLVFNEPKSSVTRTVLGMVTLLCRRHCPFLLLGAY